MYLSDAELVQLWHNGDDVAFEMIYKRYASKLLATAMRKTGERSVSEEFVNDAFLKLYTEKQKKRNIESIEAYLSTIIKNRVIDHYRHVSVQKKYEEFRAKHYSELDFSTINELQAKELREQIDLDMAKLPPKCRTVFNLSRFSNMSNKEIAQFLDISENTVEQHMRKALRLMKSSLSLYSQYSGIILIFVKSFL